ncbi:MAG TPA: hypothetical protein VM821_05335, partial [Abditibacteriaceae bacterium]|nr:hypothetical protein [Abditibacteriaceae bacterium]
RLFNIKENEVQSVLRIIIGMQHGFNVAESLQNSRGFLWCIVLIVLNKGLSCVNIGRGLH